MKELKLAWRYVRRHWWQYILGILALFIVDEVNTYVPRFTGEITNGLDQHTLDMGGVMGLVWKIVLIGVIIAVGRFAWRFFLFGSARSIEKELRSDLFAHLSSLSPHYYNEHKTGDLMARFINDLQAVRTLVGMNVISAFDATVMLLLVLWQMMTYVSPKLTGVAVLPLILIIFGDYFYGKVMHKRFLAKQQAFSTLTDQVQETVSGIRVIKSFVQERKELYAFAKTTLFTKEKNLGVVRLQALVMPLLDLIVGIASLLTLAYGGYLAIYGEINIGQFISFNSYVTMLVWPMMAVGECITSVSQGLASLRRIQEIFDAKPEIVDGDMVNPSIQTLKGDIDIEHLSFAYPDQPTVPVLEDVSVHVKAGETLAVLAGDALQPEAFRLIAEAPCMSAESRVEAIRVLSHAAGADGMVAGQVIDTLCGVSTQQELTGMYRLKTGVMISAAAELGCVASGMPAAMRQQAIAFADKLGLAFQIRDDMLDVVGDEAVFGKPIGSDREEGKVTFVDVLGLEGCRTAVEECTRRAEEAILSWPDHDFLLTLAHSLEERKK